MRYLFLILFLGVLTSMCSCGNKRPKGSLKDTVVTDSVPIGYNSQNSTYKTKSVYTVRNNHIDWDSLEPFFIIDRFNDNLEFLSVFSGIYYNNNYALIDFKDDNIFVGQKVFWVFGEQRIIGSFITDSTDEYKINYLIIHQSGDYGEQFSLISIDSTGAIIDFANLMSYSGDGGDAYDSNIKRVKKYIYEVTYLESHQNSNDTMEVIKGKTLLHINLNGSFTEDELSKRKEFRIVGEKAIQSFWDKENY